MKILLIIPIHNRAEYLKKCLSSIANADLTDTTIMLINDASKEKEAIKIFDSFYVPGIPIIKVSNDENLKVYGSIRKALEYPEFDLFINLDSDAIVKPDFITRLIGLKTRFPENIISGFNCMTLNRDSSERHPVIASGEDYVLKKSVGGINFCFDAQQAKEIIIPVLDSCCEIGGNWDHMVSIKCMSQGLPMICTKPSVIQHIGLRSSMGHTERPDVADDFDTPSKIKLDNVTLFIIDTKNPDGLIHAVNKSTESFEFEDVVALTSAEHLSKLSESGISGQEIEINSKEEYSEFMMKKMTNFVKTDFVLVIQSDGFILNPKAWSSSFLRYDYIGAPWWYKDGHNVGNGGFSLRSKKLLNELQSADIRILHPEDERIGRTYRKVLESKGINFAPETVAERFSIEAHGKRDKKYKGSFGFHGYGVDFSRTPEIKKVVPVNPLKGPKTYIFNQFRGLGDILFIMKIAQSEVMKGNRVIFPVDRQYLDIAKHFPTIDFISKGKLNINYEKREPYTYRGCEVIPFRFANDILKVPYTECMKAKYWYWKEDWETWKDFDIVRDEPSERKLLDSLKIKGDYNFINRSFRTNFSGKSPIQVSNGLQNVEMSLRKGFSLIDWSLTLERASNIYTVGTSINYLIEKLDINVPIHLYKRLPDEDNFDNYKYILDEEKKNYIFH